MTRDQPPDDPFVKEIRRQANLGERGRHQTFWHGLGQIGAFGWMVSVPAVLGALLGKWLDQRYGTEIFWTLSLLVLGLFLGCTSAWRFIQRETR